MTFYLKFRLFELFRILCYGQCVYHVLNVTIHEALQIVCGVAYSVIRHASLRIVVGPDFGTTVARGDQCLAFAGNVIDILLMLSVIDEGTQA